MVSPVLVGLGALQVGGSLLSITARRSAARQQARASIFNAEVERARQGAIALEGRRRETESRRVARRLMATQRAEIGASGFSFVGQPSQIVAETAARAELDAMIARDNAEAAINESRARAIGDRRAARSSRRSSNLQTTAGILGTGVSLLRIFGGRS